MLLQIRKIITKITTNMQEPKKLKVPVSVITRDLEAISKPTNNVYESLIVVSKRAKQIAARTKEELNLKLQDFAIPSDSLTEVFENQEQIEISRYYERMPKPTSSAIEELLEGRLFYRRTQGDSTEENSNL